MRSEVRKIHYEVTQTRNLLSHSVFLSLFFFFKFWPLQEACGIIVSQIPDLKPGIKSTPLAVEVQSLNPVDHAAAAAAKSLQSCLTLCDPIVGSPLGSPVPVILQARTLEWVAISFSNA